MSDSLTPEQHLAQAREDLRATLYAFHASGVVPYVEVINASGEDCAPCAACRALHGRRFSIEDALARDILPCPECTGGWTGGPRGCCRCDFLPVQDQRKRSRETQEPAPSWFRRFLDI
ncbi:MAG: hypothetical protein ABIP93_20480 [Gemmatimonadaceae bacterium]